MRSFKLALVVFGVAAAVGTGIAGLGLTSKSVAADVVNCPSTSYMSIVDRNNANPLTTLYGKAAVTLPGVGAVIPVSSVALASNQPVNIGSSSSGVGAAKVQIGPLSFNKPIDASSGYFFTSESAGTAFPSVTIYSGVCIQGASTFTAKTTVKLGIVVIQQINDDISNSIETVTLSYGAQYVAVRTIQPDGTLSSAIGGGWNRLRNIVWDGNSPV